MNRYIVWAGGTPIYEGTNKENALNVVDIYIEMDYDDICMEKLTDE